MIGTIQATEAVKLLAGIGHPLIGRLLTYDALSMRFREVKLRRDPNCALCGENPTIKDLSVHKGGEPEAGRGINTGEPEAGRGMIEGGAGACAVGGDGRGSSAEPVPLSKAGS